MFSKVFKNKNINLLKINENNNLNYNLYEKILKSKKFYLLGSYTYKEQCPPEFFDKMLYFDNIKYKDDGHDFNYNLIKSIISDFNFQLLWSRFDRFKRKKYNTEISRFEYQIKIIKSAILFISHYKISKIIFAYEPHNLPMYIFKCVCVKMGIENISFNFSPFPNRIFAIDGIKNKIIKKFKRKNLILINSFHLGALRTKKKLKKDFLV